MSKIYQRKKIKKIILLISILLAFSTSSYLLLKYSLHWIQRLNFFNISKISITADEYLDKNKILLASGLVGGTNIFAIDVDRIVLQVLNDPWIKRVKISRKYPNEILIEAKNKDICAIVKQNQKLFYLDCFGSLIDKYNAKINKEFIIFESYNNNYLPILNFLDKLSTINTGAIFNLQNISEIILADEFYFIVKLQKRISSIHLTTTNLEEKLNELNKVLNDLDNRNETASKIDATLTTNKIVVKKISQ